MYVEDSWPSQVGVKSPFYVNIYFNTITVSNAINSVLYV